jgi:uncharacterized Ntn-hydrolase superfamily protein
LLESQATLKAMARSFGTSTDTDFPKRLLETLDAGQEAGGDVRGKQAAALLVVSSNVTSNFWSGRVVDLRVDDHPEPMQELRRLLRLHTAYVHAYRGSNLLREGRFGEADREYKHAIKVAPENDELRFWRAVSLFEAGKVDEAKTVLGGVLDTDERWGRVAKSFTRIGLLSGPGSPTRPRAERKSR